MGYVQKYDVKVRDRTMVRLAIEDHLEEVFSALEIQCYLSDFQTFHNNIQYAQNILSFLVNVNIMAKKDADKYYKKIVEIQKERIYCL